MSLVVNERKKERKGIGKCKERKEEGIDILICKKGKVQRMKEIKKAENKKNGIKKEEKKARK